MIEEMDVDKTVYYLKKLELHKRFGKVFGKILLRGQYWNLFHPANTC